MDTGAQEKPTNLLRVDPAVRVTQVESIQKLKSERDGQRVEKCLADLKLGAEGDVNLMPLILEAVRAYITLGEICNVLREVFGEYQQVNTLGR